MNKASSLALQAIEGAEARARRPPDLWIRAGGERRGKNGAKLPFAILYIDDQVFRLQSADVKRIVSQGWAWLQSEGRHA